MDQTQTGGTPNPIEGAAESGRVGTYGIFLTPSTVSVLVGPIPHAPKPTPAALGISGYDGMDKDVRRTIMNDIRKIENYDGTIQGDAARK
ncbi:hypothetical protein N7491_009163 [Penicillium cf. griseofulvum]|nr:hypothetical protein N7491_009163 [Penicillium cf. griseofulvum]